MTTSTPNIMTVQGWGARDVTCFTVALAIHALLLLWKGGMFTLPEAVKQENVLVSVNFESDVPSYETPAAAAPQKESFLSRMKTLIKGEAAAPKPKVDVFAQKPTTPTKPDALELAKGKTQDTQLVTAPANVFKPTTPKLKENQFKLAQKDTPFKIATSKDQDVLANSNVIPVQVGQKTTLTSKPFDSSQMPKLQSKQFSGNSGGSALAMGSMSAPSNQTPSLNNSAASSNASARSASATSKEWTGRSTFNNSMGSSQRNTISDFGDSPVQTKSSSAKSSNFNITGALAHRPIVQRSFAAYEMDARVALRFRVDWSGRVLDGILVEISSGSPSFDQKVIAALKEWIFSRLPGDRANEIQEGVITFIFKGV